MSQPLIIILVVAGYFLLLLGLSHVVSRGADNATFFQGNRRMAWPLVAMAMICAPITGVTFISVPGMVTAKGFTYLQMCLGFIVGYLIIGRVLLPVFYRNRVASIYSYLGERFGDSAYRTGAWMFLVSKILGTSVRFFVICATLQILVFGPLGLPFPLTVVATLSLIWLYTVKGGVKAVIWTDMLKCCVLIVSVVVSICLIVGALGLHADDLLRLFGQTASESMFNFSEPAEETYFWKQFVAGIFLVVAMTGLDQDMMQHALSCRDARASRKNMVVSSVMQFVVIALFLFLGTLLALYAQSRAIAMPEKSDDLFATVAFHEGLPPVVGILFVLGLVSATYSSLGSALTSLTTSYTIDILGAHRRDTADELKRRRNRVHTGIAAVMAVVIIMFYYLSRQDAISAVFMLASYTYGPILGLFMLGLFTRRRVNAGWLPWVCLAAPAVCLVLQWACRAAFDYQIGFELLLINAGLTIAGLVLVPSAESAKRPVAEKAE